MTRRVLEVGGGLLVAAGIAITAVTVFLGVCAVVAVLIAEVLQ